MNRQRSFRSRRVSVVALSSLLLLVGGARAFAQWVVFDPSNYQEAIQELLQLQQQYAQLVNSYKLLKQQATALTGDLNARYRSLATPWLALTAPDTYGVTGGWIRAADTAQQVAAGYQQLTEPLTTYPGSMPVAADELGRIQRAYGGLELQDGVNQHSLEMIGHLRAKAGDVEFALRRLEDDSYSTDPALNTEVAVLNKVNAATVTSARLTKDTNQILLALLDQRLADARRQRDVEAIAIDAHIAFETQARDLLTSSTAGTTEALTSFRLP